MNLQGKINVIKEAKDNIKSAIVAKGVIPTGNISTYSTAISEIDTTNNINLTIVPSTTTQTLRPPSNYTGYGVITVNPVTATIDSNIISDNIKTGCEILGINGNVVELNGQTTTITTNGTYVPEEGYNGFTNVIVDTPMGIKREVSSGVLIRPTTFFTVVLPNEVIDIGDSALNLAYTSCIGVREVDFSNLTSVSGNNALEGSFQNCGNLINVNLSNLASISGYASLRRIFSYTHISSINLSSLVIIDGDYALSNAFYACVELTSINLSNLTTVNSARCFEYFCCGCNMLQSVAFPKLSSITKEKVFTHAFEYCTALENLYFPSLNSSSFGTKTDQFLDMLKNVNGCIVHFPSNLQPIISSWNDVINGFGGQNTTILFDLEETT